MEEIIDHQLLFIIWHHGHQILNKSRLCWHYHDQLYVFAIYLSTNTSRWFRPAPILTCSLLVIHSLTVNVLYLTIFRVANLTCLIIHNYAIRQVLSTCFADNTCIIYAPLIRFQKVFLESKFSIKFDDTGIPLIHYSVDMILSSYDKWHEYCRQQARFLPFWAFYIHQYSRYLIFNILMTSYCGVNSSINREDCLVNGSIGSNTLLGFLWANSWLALIFSATGFLSRLGNSTLPKFFIIVMVLAVATSSKCYRPSSQETVFWLIIRVIEDVS